MSSKNSLPKIKPENIIVRSSLTFFFFVVLNNYIYKPYWPTWTYKAEEEMKLSRWVLGVTLLIGVVIIWVGSSVLMQYIFLEQDFPHPFFLTYFSTSLFSLYLFGFAFSKKWRNARGHIEWISVPTEETTQGKSRSITIANKNCDCFSKIQSGDDEHEVISSETHLIEQGDSIQGEVQILSPKQVRCSLDLKSA